ncbi:hypothetical protein BT69DRAFT_1287068 [Atractiella rhizophila]|nr:hypothetical protein BT69DRAFT_1287068 [Atractiella rhizophila]
MFIRKWTPGQEGNETETTLGWLNDFDFSIHNSLPDSSADGQYERNKKDQVDICGTFIFLSRCALQAVSDVEDNAEVEDDGDRVMHHKGDDDRDVDDIDNDDMYEDANDSTSLKPAWQRLKPSKHVPPLYQQTIMDDVESVFFCIFYLFCHFVPLVQGQTGPFTKRTWSTNTKTSMGQSSGRIFGSKDPSSILGVETVSQKGRYPLARWEEAVETALESKLSLLDDRRSKETFSDSAIQLLGGKVKSWTWDRNKVVSLLWEVSQPLRLDPEHVKRRKKAPFFPDGSNSKAVVRDIIDTMVKALEKGKETFKNP